MPGKRNPFTSPATAEELDRPLDFRIACQLPAWELLPPQQPALRRREMRAMPARRNEPPVTASAALAQNICGCCSSQLDEGALFCSECGGRQCGGGE